jgi:hypothetical protein
MTSKNISCGQFHLKEKFIIKNEWKKKGLQQQKDEENEANSTWQNECKWQERKWHNLLENFMLCLFLPAC